MDAAPYRESGHRFMMQALSLEGNIAQATLVFDGLRARLRDDLGIAPSEETLRLHSDLLQADGQIRDRDANAALTRRQRALTSYAAP